MNGNGHQLPPGWVIAALDDVAELVRGIAFPSSAKSLKRAEGLIACLRTTNVQQSVEWEDLWWVPNEYVKRPAQLVKPLDILISVANSYDLVGKVALVEQLASPTTIGAFIALIRCFQPLDGRCLYYFLASPAVQSSIRAVASTTVNISNVNTTKVRALRLPIPPAKEQSHIADALDELFSDLDAGVAALERVRTKLKLYRAAVLKAAVEGTITAEWREQHPAVEPASEMLKLILADRRHLWEEEQLAKFKSKVQEPPKDWKTKYKDPIAPDTTNVPALPEGWVVASMDALTVHITSGSRDWQQFYGTGSGTFIMAQNVRPGRFDQSVRQRVNPPVQDPSCERSLVQMDDLLVTIVGANTGDVCRVPELLSEHYVCQSVALMRPVDRRLANYLDCYCNSVGGAQFHYRRYIYGAGRPHLSFDQLKMTPVLLPPLPEQEAIVEAVEDHLSIVEHLRGDLDARLENARALRQSILHHAFTGQLVPQDPNDEPASELLKRISGEREASAREAAAKRAKKNNNGPRADRRGRQKKRPTKDD